MRGVEIRDKLHLAAKLDHAVKLEHHTAGAASARTDYDRLIHRVIVVQNCVELMYGLLVVFQI